MFLWGLFLGAGIGFILAGLLINATHSHSYEHWRESDD